MLRNLLTPIWNQRHRVFRGVRRAQSFLGGLIARIPLPVSVKIMAGDMLFLALEAFVFHTETYQHWRKNRIGRGRIHALLGNKNPSFDEDAPPPSAPTDSEWQQVKPPATEGAAVDVIIPVYGGYEATLRCLYSVLTSRNKTPCEVIVVNDATPDAALAAKLYELAGRDLFTLVEQEENKGFVASVNRGMQLHPKRDVLLLNADTEVYGDWLDRLAAHVKDAPAVGSVTPLSNNAEICSYPYTLRDNRYAPEGDFSVFDKLAMEANKGRSCEVPTGVGFCMYITRACLRDTGDFDEETFGKGYGEENDFCQRAAKHGYRHLLAGDVFVRHAGGESFGEEKKARAKAAWKLLKKRYSDYPKQVAAFVANDPALPLRRALDIARMQQHRRTRNVLMVSHALGGGTQKHIDERLQKLAKGEDTGGFLLTPVKMQEGMIALTHPDAPHTPNMVFSLNDEQEKLEAALKAVGITRIEVHHLIGFPEGMMEYLRRFAERFEAGYEVFIHDYYFFCPRLNLTTEEDRYCGEPEIADCEACIATRSSYAGGAPVWLWRERARDFLRGAKAVIAPDADVSKRMEKYFLGMKFRVQPHETDLAGAPALTRVYKSGEVLKVGLLGALSPLKGARVVEALVKDAEARNLPLEFVLIGYSDYAPLNRPHPRLHITGRYKDEELEKILRAEQPHLLLFPSIWPETYCYALSHAFRYRIPPVAFDLGAQASRMRQQGFGTLLPSAMADAPSELNDTLLSLKSNPGVFRRAG